MSNQESSTITPSSLSEWVKRFSTQVVLHFDQGTALVCRLLKKVCHTIRIHETRKRPCHPRSKSLVERTGGTITKLLHGFIEWLRSGHRYEIPLQCLSLLGYSPSAYRIHATNTNPRL
ncbi:uncharacterized protein DEA37_0012123 [Paragonimus westermani]|uniref:Integrase catalytic domain-containing protein n=1 Tax=Paragonimus westermani TaxID=34504 RepID=A0A5J4NI77_9TREM|nr:uncharacterized protein DEA37_0012123 [Paragonimus westermani]